MISLYLKIIIIIIIINNDKIPSNKQKWTLKKVEYIYKIWWRYRRSTKHYNNIQRRQRDAIWSEQMWESPI